MESSPVLFYSLMGSAAALSIALGLLALFVNPTTVETVLVDDPEVDYYEEEFPRD